MLWLAVLGIAVGNNLDNAGVGLALGMRRVRLTALANAWVSVVTFAITGAAALAGKHAARFLGHPAAHALSTALLCGTGAWMLLALREAELPVAPERDAVGAFGLGRATLLALALSVNNVGGGVSAGLVHLSPLWVAAASAAVSFAALGLGGWAGDRASARFIGGRGPALAGGLLVLIGLLQLR